MSTFRLRLSVGIAFLALTVALIAVAPRLARGSAAERTPASPALLPSYGLRARIPDAYSGAPISMLADPARDRLYIPSNETFYTDEGSAVYVIDTRQATRLTTVEDVELYYLTLAQDGTRLIGYTPYPESGPGRLLVIDADSLAIVDDFPLTCAPDTETCSVADMAAGPDGRLYWITSNEPLVNVLDMTSGEVLDRFVAADDTPVNRIEIAGENLFVFEQVDYNSSRQMRRYDISTATAALELIAPDEYGGYDWLVAPDGSFLVSSGPSGVMQYDAGTLQLIRTIFNGGWQQPIGGLVVSPDSERVIIMIRVPNENQPLYGYAAATGEQVITGMVDMSHIGYPGIYFPMAALAGGDVAIGYGGFVDIYYDTDHVSAIPVTFANYCAGGPVFDDFSDVNSGWPSRIAEGLTFGYVDNEYAILQDDADRWFGVSRGDKWLNGRQVAIRTRLTRSEGLSGLIFGLNDNWSHFYTFEIIPDLGRWAIFEFRQDIGWTLVATDISSRINPIGEWNELEISDRFDGGEMTFFINGYSINIRLLAPDGRVGLSAGSFAPGFEARYDDYRFSGQNCAVPFRGATIDQSPPLTRPPLEDFLK